MSFRVLGVDEEGKINRVSCSKFNDLLFKKGKIPNFAGQTVCMAIFYGESTDKRFATIYRSEYSKFKFDLSGSLDKDFWSERLSAMADCVHILPLTESETHRLKFRKKSRADKYDWSPTKEEESRLIDLVLFT